MGCCCLPPERVTLTVNSKKETNGKGQDGLLWSKSAVKTINGLRLGQKESACAWVKLGLAPF